MKKLLVFFFSCAYLTNLLGQTNKDFQTNNDEKIKIAKLHGFCDVQIIKKKLIYANKTENLDLNELEASFKKLYEKCSLIINTPGLPQLTEKTWTNNMIKEILTLKQDDETRNCLNKAMIKLQDIKEIQCEKNKAIIIKDFYNYIDNCLDQYSQKIALSHLDAEILRWKDNHTMKICDHTLNTIMLKNIPEEQENLEQEIQHFYKRCFPDQKIKFEQYIKNIRDMINVLKSDSQMTYCLENFLKFQAAYEKAQTEDKKNELKKSFAMTYIQCKNK